MTPDILANDGALASPVDQIAQRTPNLQKVLVHSTATSTATIRDPLSVSIANYSSPVIVTLQRSTRNTVNSEALTSASQLPVPQIPRMPLKSANTPTAIVFQTPRASGPKGYEEIAARPWELEYADELFFCADELHALEMHGWEIDDKTRV